MSVAANSKELPFVSICTPTFNRRPFIPFIIKCFENQTYPKNRMEWIIIDDGTDPIEDMVANIPQVKYYKYSNKMTLGKKRNLMHNKSSGSILVYMDDDDYYPPERVSHAVETLQNNPQALCAGSSEMCIYFKHIHRMYQFGPYGPNHSTAATFAFRRELLKQTSYDENASLAEEKKFLKDYTIPFVQMDPMKCILVFSHVHNSFDKKTMLETLPNPFIKESPKQPTDFVKERDILQFFMNDIDKLLIEYEPGSPANKTDVLKQISEIKQARDNQNAKMNLQHVQQLYEKKIGELTMENIKLKDKNEYLEKKIKELIQKSVQLKMNSGLIFNGSNAVI